MKKLYDKHLSGAQLKAAVEEVRLTAQGKSAMENLTGFTKLGDTKWRAWVKATGTMQMKKELKNLEWTQGPVGWRKSGVLVEFSDLAFHFTAR